MKEYEVKMEEDSPFSGSVLLEIPDKKTRSEIKKAIDLKLKDGHVVMEDDVQAQADKMIDKCRTFIKSIDLKIKLTQTDIKSIEDLEYYQEGEVLLYSLCGNIIGGIRLGKS